LALPAPPVIPPLGADEEELVINNEVHRMNRRLGIVVRAGLQKMQEDVLARQLAEAEVQRQQQLAEEERRNAEIERQNAENERRNAQNARAIKKEKDDKLKEQELINVKQKFEKAITLPQLQELATVFNIEKSKSSKKGLYVRERGDKGVQKNKPDYLNEMYIGNIISTDDLNAMKNLNEKQIKKYIQDTILTKERPTVIHVPPSQVQIFSPPDKMQRRLSMAYQQVDEQSKKLQENEKKKKETNHSSIRVLQEQQS